MQEEKLHRLRAKAEVAKNDTNSFECQQHKNTELQSRLLYTRTCTGMIIIMQEGFRGTALSSLTDVLLEFVSTEKRQISQLELDSSTFALRIARAPKPVKRRHYWAGVMSHMLVFHVAEHDILQLSTSPTSEWKANIGALAPRSNRAPSKHRPHMAR